VWLYAGLGVSIVLLVAIFLPGIGVKGRRAPLA
jgi:hypothetical protein